MEKKIDFFNIFSMILKKWWIILLCIIIAGVSSFVYTELFVTPLYVSSGLLYVTNSGYSYQDNININDINAAKQLVSTYAEILKSNTFLETVANRCGLDYTAEQIRSMINTKQKGETEFLQISVTLSNPEHATKIAQTILICARNEIEKVVDGGSAKVVDNASTPVFPSYPNVTKNTLVGVLVGFILGVGLIFLLSYLDTTIKSEEDIENKYNLPILGIIPNVNDAAKRKDGYKSHGY